MSAIWQEIKRRNVFKVAVVYLIAAWVTMQVVDVMFPALQLPEWLATAVAALLLLGFPFALILAWAFEVTPAVTNPVAVVAKPSIAVLPFVNMSDDAANEYFSDGLSEELLNLLAKIPRLHVAGRNVIIQVQRQQ